MDEPTMCDSFVALPPATVNGSMILAKSADCQVNEAHALVRFPRRKHVPGARFKSTHLVIPQVAETYEVILSKSFWTWGAEIGINEYGVAIGNEAVFTTLQAHETQDGLMVIDMLRIGLERGRTAREAVEAITTALEMFGQGGNCELSGNSHFDGSYLIADPKEAWVLETAGREWVARQVKDSVGSISNVLSIGDDYDLSSLSQRVHWANAYGQTEIVAAIGSCERQANSYSCLAQNRGQVSVKTAFDTLRHHGEGYHPAVGEVPTNICMHAGPQKNRGWQACSAMVAEMSADGVVGWFTATSGTCLSIFKPVFPGVELPTLGIPSEQYASDTLWWKHEHLHRRAMLEFDTLMPAIRADFDRLEAQFLAEAPTVLKGTQAEKQAFVDHCFEVAEQATDAWIARLASSDHAQVGNAEYGKMWEHYNAQAEFAF
jgi:secernin